MRTHSSQTIITQIQSARKSKFRTIFIFLTQFPKAQTIYRTHLFGPSGVVSTRNSLLVLVRMHDYSFHSLIPAQRFQSTMIPLTESCCVIQFNTTKYMFPSLRSSVKKTNQVFTYAEKNFENDSTNNAAVVEQYSPKLINNAKHWNGNHSRLKL